MTRGPGYYRDIEEKQGKEMGLKGFSIFALILTGLVGLCVGNMVGGAVDEKDTTRAQAEWDLYKDECNGTPAGRNLKEKTIRVVCEDGAEYYIPQEVKI